MTSVAGHVYSTDFPREYGGWDKVPPVKLFDAPTVKKLEKSSFKVKTLLQKQSAGVDFVVLWLDCDREGENICFEVLDIIKGNLPRGARE